MRPARNLLSLLFLILMGTELTQVRACNAIFLPACEAPARPRGARQSRGAATARPGTPARAPSQGLGERARVPAAPGVEEGVKADPRVLPRPPGPSALNPPSWTPGLTTPC